MKLRLNQTLRAAILSAMAAVVPYTYADTTLIAEGIDVDNVMNSTRFYDTGKGHYFSWYQYTTITANTTPSLSDFLTSATTMEFTLPTNYVSITPNNSTSDMHITSVEATYVYNKFNDIYLAYDTYVPNEEGNTLLLVEVKDGVTPATLQQSGLATFTNNTFDNYNITDYNSLRNVVDAKGVVGECCQS